MDEWLQERFESEALWYVELSNGQRFVQDDNRPGSNPPSAWLRLRNYLETNHLSIQKFYIGFRDNILYDILPHNAEGYFFRKNLATIMGERQILSFYIIGYLQDNRVFTQKVKVPEMIVTETSERNPEDCGISLIKNVMSYS